MLFLIQRFIDHITNRNWKGVYLHVYLASMHSAGWDAGLAGANPGGRGMELNWGADQPGIFPACHCGIGCLGMPLGGMLNWLNLANRSWWAGVGACVAGGGWFLLKLTAIIAGSICVQSENDAVLVLFRKPARNGGVKIHDAYLDRSYMRSAISKTFRTLK